MSRKLIHQTCLKLLACLALALLAACTPYASSGLGVAVGGSPTRMRADIVVTSPGAWQPPPAPDRRMPPR